MTTKLRTLAGELAELEAQRLQGKAGSAELSRRQALMNELMDLLASVPSAEERRRSRRFPAFGEVSVAKDNTVALLNLLDVSATGLALLGRLQAAPGDQLQLERAVVEQVTVSLQLTATVMWAKREPEGMRLGLEVSPAEADALRPLVDLVYLGYLRQLASGDSAP